MMSEVRQRHNFLVVPNFFFLGLFGPPLTDWPSRHVVGPLPLQANVGELGKADLCWWQLRSQYFVRNVGLPATLPQADRLAVAEVRGQRRRMRQPAAF